MFKFTNVILFHILLPLFGFSQSQYGSKTKDMLNNIFHETKVPSQIDYSKVIDEDAIIYDYESYMSTIGPISERKIDFNEFIVLFQKLDSISEQNIWSLEEFSPLPLRKYYEKYEIYGVFSFSVNDSIFAFVVEIINKRQGGSEQILFSIDNNKNIIDKLPLAFYTQSGTFTTNEGGRAPWWVNSYSIISESYLIERDGRGLSFYQINGNGQIIKTKQ